MWTSEHSAACFTLKIRTVLPCSHKPQVVPTHRAAQEPIERKMGTLCLLFLHEKQHVDKRIRKSPAMGMSVIPLSRSIGQFHLCLVLFFGCSHAVVPARGVTERLSQVAAAFILCQGESGVCRVLVEVLFGLKGCVTMCLCYKRQVG